MLSAAKRISKTSNRDLKANSLFFIITNLVLFVNYIVQMSIRNFITYYNESITNYYQGYVIAYIGVAAVALCGVFTVFALFHESYSKSHADLAYSLPAGAKERFKALHTCKAAHLACSFLEHHSVYFHYHNHRSIFEDTCKVCRSAVSH